MAELGFLGLVVKIFEQTPLTKGLDSRAGTLLTGGRWDFRAPRRFCCKVTEREGVVENVRTAGRREGPAMALRKSELTMLLSIVEDMIVLR